MSQKSNARSSVHFYLNSCHSSTTSVCNESFCFWCYFFTHKNETTQILWQDKTFCVYSLRVLCIIFEFPFMCSGQHFSRPEIDFLPGSLWVGFTRQFVYMLPTWNRPGSTLGGLIITRSVGWPDGRMENLPHHCKTFLTAISHFPATPSECFPRISLLSRLFSTLLQSEAHRGAGHGQNSPSSAPATDVSWVPYTFGLFAVPGAVLLVPFLCLCGKKCRIRFVWQSSFEPWLAVIFFYYYFWFFLVVGLPGRKFKMFTYLTNIHYHATYYLLQVVVPQYS